MKITTNDPVVQTETTAHTNHSEEFFKKYSVDGVMSCRKCPLGTDENVHMCPGGPDEDCIEAIEKFLEDEDCDEESISLEEAAERIKALIDELRKKFLYDNNEVIATTTPDPVNTEGYTLYNVAVRQAEAVNHPSHYTSGKIECIDAIECAVDSYDDPKAAFLVGQVIKYLWRAPLKGAYRQDIEKAQWYLDRLVAQFDEKKGK